MTFNITDTTSLYSAARIYADAGMWVIPIVPGERRPAVKWQDMKAPADDQQLREWFQKHNYGVGILTGQKSGVIVIDVDTYKINGRADTVLSAFTSDLVVETPSGGRHIYFRTNGTLIANSQSKLEEGVDVRGDGGIAIMPPSLAQKKDGSGMGRYRFVSAGDPSPLPDALTASTKKQTTTEKASGSDDALSLFNLVVREGFTDGKHNEQLNQLAAMMWRVMASSNDSLKERFIYEALSALDAKDPTPQAATGNLVPTITSAINYEKHRLSAKKSVAPQFSTTEYSEVMQQYADYNLEYLIDEWLPRKSVTLIAAMPESYKTWIGLDATLSLAFGDKDTKFLGQYCVPHERMPVLVVQQEDFMGLITSRIRTIMAAKLRDATWDFQQTGENSWVFDHPGFAPIHISNQERHLSFDEPETIEQLEQIIAKSGVKFVYIDPFYTLASAADYFAEASRQMSLIKNIRNKYDVTFLFAHHTVKNQQVTGRARISGSNYLNAAVECVWLIDQTDEPATIIMERMSKFTPGHVKKRIHFDISTVSGEEDYQVTLEDMNATMTGNEGLIYDLINERGSITHKEVCEETGIAKTTVTGVLARLVEQGHLTKIGRKYTVKETLKGF